MSRSREYAGLGARADAVIVGAGIAGLATAYHLTRLGVTRVVVIEREPTPAAHASGRNAGIFRPVESQPLLASLARGTAANFLAAPWGQGLLRSTGLVLVARRDAEATLDQLAGTSRSAGTEVLRLSPAQAQDRSPLLDSGRLAGGLFCAEGGVLDIHGMAQVCLERAREAGARLRTGCHVQRILSADGRVAGVLTREGERIEASVVVNAAGAWAGALGEASGAARLPLSPRRRHLVQLRPASPVDASGTVTWDVSEPVYFRPESGGVLASPCDEDPAEPRTPEPDPWAVEELGRKLAVVAPALAQARVQRSWACLRTLTPDDLPVIGEDPRLPGLFWIAGLGGHGMSIGPEAARVAAALIVGRQPAEAPHLAPSRLEAQLR